MSGASVTAEYLDGIREGRATLREHGIDVAADCLATARELCRRFPAASPVGQVYRGERDFWLNQLRKHGAAPGA